MSLIPSNIKKIDRPDGMLTFLNVTPDEQTKDFKILGIGVQDYGVDYSPTVNSEKWIIELNSRVVHESNEKQASVTQTTYKNDPLFEFVAKGRDKLNYKTEILDIDVWDGTESSGVITAPAKLSDGIIAISSWMSSESEIEWELHYSGDPVEGTATVDINAGTATFTPSTSL